MEDLKGKAVFITGSSIGIGREDAYKFAGEGCKVVITYYKDRKEAEKVAKKCLELSASETLVLKLDVMNNKSIKEAVKQAVGRFKKIDILVNNAGIVVWKKLKDQGYDEIENQVRTNLEGMIKMTKECLPYTTDKIINMASGAGLEGFAELTTYCATKWGVRGFTKALAEEIPRIKVYSINPGAIATRMNDFKGMSPQKVAQVILDVARERYNLKSGSDVNIWDYAK